MASGLCAALTGRTHGCTDQPANVKKTLANSEPSTHGTSRHFAAPQQFGRFQTEADTAGRFMSTRPKTCNHGGRDRVARFDRPRPGGFSELKSSQEPMLC
jgi:hypothetical protein